MSTSARVSALLAEAGVDENDVLRLDLQLCFALHSAARAYDGLYRQLLSGTGLTYPQYLVMLVLWEHGDMPVKRLGEFLRLDSGTLSPLLKRMESAGFVSRERSQRDERSVTVVLTEKGTDLRATALQIPVEALVATGLTVDGIHEMRTRLTELTEALDDAARAT
jgi:DNA-binding MarR family transcriptional regulator